MSFRQISQECKPDRRWMTAVLLLAAFYNIAWGAAAVIFPSTMLAGLSLDPMPIYPEFWQCIGMIVGVYGIGYAAAALDPVRHWPIVLVGLLGKIFGPIGFAQSVFDGRLPAAMGWTILTNDLIWWFPFSAILWVAVHENHAARQLGMTDGKPELTPHEQPR